nr:MAG TPA: hypothetical protein [Caudoviricetes sp.]
MKWYAEHFLHLRDPVILYSFIFNTFRNNVLRNNMPIYFYIE